MLGSACAKRTSSGNGLERCSARGGGGAKLEPSAIASGDAGVGACEKGKALPLLRELGQAKFGTGNFGCNSAIISGEKWAVAGSTVAKKPGNEGHSRLGSLLPREDRSCV
ncbi:unnamed protein product [Prorocentrum cordatum]|uniref:Uncharacterized protein n=1 Tax=Prorocentrum cordatum TaxID=2364126 RepID=A0ABN9TCS6_9DINO|nr:unnamed protein product [Polarella glacialis]